MKSPAPDVDLRVPLGWRLYVGVFGLVWLALCATFALEALRGGSATGAIVVVMLLFGETLVVRTLRTRATTSGATLTVRNVLSTRTIERSRIEGIHVGRPTGNPSRLGEVLTVLERGGAMTTIEASRRTALTAGGKNALEEQREALEAWRRSR